MAVPSGSCLISESRRTSYSARLLEEALFGLCTKPGQSMVLRLFPCEGWRWSFSAWADPLQDNYAAVDGAFGRIGTPIHVELLKQSASTDAGG